MRTEVSRSMMHTRSQYTNPIAKKLLLGSLLVFIQTLAHGGQIQHRKYSTSLTPPVFEDIGVKRVSGDEFDPQLRVSAQTLSGCSANTDSGVIAVAVETECPCFLYTSLVTNRDVVWDIMLMTSASYRQWVRENFFGLPDLVGEYSFLEEDVPGGRGIELQERNVFLNGSYTFVLRFRPADAGTRACVTNGVYVFEEMPEACPILVEDPTTNTSNATEAVQTRDEYEHRIVGGTAAQTTGDRLDHFPWMAMFWSVSESKPICGGSHIAPGFVLTAAHCEIDKEIGDLRVRIGSVHASTGTLHTIRNVWNHPEYEVRPRGDVVNDISLVQIDDLDPGKEKDVIPWNTSPNLPPEGANVTIAGYGRISEDWNLKPDPNHLRRVDVEVWTESACLRQFSDHEVAAQICASQKSGGCDSCQYVHAPHLSPSLLTSNQLLT